MHPTIIIPAFRRPYSLLRLLQSLEAAKYPDKDVHLIISLDGGADVEVVNIAKSFRFSHGDVEVIVRERNIGLREHILWCGDQSNKYGSVIILEDDLIVDPYFYHYAVSSLSFYEHDEIIAGLALYSPKFNEYVNLPFEPMYNGSSTYLMQVACSCGQAWTAMQWSLFKSWYETSTEKDIDSCLALPDAVKKWPKSSWKKYFDAYLVLHSKFFVYPYQNYTSNCSDVGGKHIVQGSNLFQVPLGSEFRQADNFHYFTTNESMVHYDAFMEPCGQYVSNLLGLSLSDFEIDFYASKPIDLLRSKKYCVTTRETKIVLKKFPIRFKPIEKNLFFECESPNGLYAALTNAVGIKQSRYNFNYYLMAEYYSYFNILSNRFVYNFIIAVMKKTKKLIKKYLLFY